MYEILVYLVNEDMTSVKMITVREGPINEKIQHIFYF